LLADGRLRVVSDNPDKTKYPDEFIEGDDLNNILIIGQVIHKMGEGGL
jgi:phage repressor protein C with HTH and peptisase S24 domain